MDYNMSYELWLNSGELTAAELKRMKELTETEKKENFFCPLAFGTAGMRGILDVGTNRMNRFTVARATKGLADYIASVGEEAMMRGVVISYDTRRMSVDFAILSAKILAANGINAYLFEGVRPVPMCSFAIRHTGAYAGIMITASHNPKVYNGYKVYGEDGAQMSPEATQKVVEFIARTPYFGIKSADISLTKDDICGKEGELCPNIHLIGKSLDDAYFAEIQKLSLSPDAVKRYGKDIKIVYTPVHGTGAMPVTTVLARMGITVNTVEEQMKPDTEFSTVRVPNPEEADTLKMGVELARKIGSDIVIGTDPDADRMGIAVKNDDGEFILLNGNQIGVLLEHYILLRKSESGELPANGAVIKTIVTTEMARRVADSFGMTTFDVLTGFKFIGEKIKEWEENSKYTYLFGFEESYGSLAGTHARDKDAVVASMMFAEMTCYLASKGKTVYDEWCELCNTYGHFAEKSKSITFGGVDGMSKMAAIMDKLKSAKYEEINGVKVLAVSNLDKGIKTYANGTVEPTGLPKTDALKLHLDKGDWICVRPSGTEPKLKLYAASSATTSAEATATAEAYLAYMSELASI